MLRNGRSGVLQYVAFLARWFDCVHLSSSISKASANSASAIKSPAMLCSVVILTGELGVPLAPQLGNVRLCVRQPFG